MSDPHRHDMAIDSDGRPLAMAPADVRTMVDRMVADGELLAVIVNHNGQIAVAVMGPPSMEVVEALEACAQQFRTAVEHAS